MSEPMGDPQFAEAYAPTLVAAVPDTAVVRAVDRSSLTVGLVVPQRPVTAPKKSVKEAPPKKRHLHVVGPNSRLRVAPEHRTGWLLSAAGAVAVLIAFGLVYLHVIAAQRQLTLDRLNTAVTQQEASYQRLRLEVAELNTPSRIIPYAEGTLKMQVPTSPTFLVPPAGSVAPATSPSSEAPVGATNWAHTKPVLAGTP